MYTIDDIPADCRERIARRITVDPDTGCWLWSGGKAHGYAMIWYDGGQRRGHKLMYQLLVGPVPEGQVVRHTCHRPSCICPDHLQLGTQLDNQADMLAAGREAKGEQHGMAKLTEDAVIVMRGLYATGRYTQRALGRMFGVTQTLVGHVVRGTIWTHLPLHPELEMS